MWVFKRGAINVSFSAHVQQLWKQARESKVNILSINIDSRKRKCDRKAKERSQYMQNISTFPL